MPILISLVAVAGVIALSLAPSALISGLRTPWPAAFEHALAYAALGLVVALSLRIATLKAAAIVVAGLAMLAGLLETAQLFVPGRSFWLSDILGSTLGAGLGVLAALTLRHAVLRFRAWRKQKNRSAPGFETESGIMPGDGSGQPFDHACDPPRDQRLEPHKSPQ